MRGLWSLGDQAILSLGNFLTGWLLLRATAPWYGNYFRIINAIWFLNNLHMALVTYPISVTSSGISDSELRRRVRRAIGMTLLLLVPESVIVTVATVSIASFSLVPWVVAALVFWQLQETVRRALMARLEHRRAIVGDIVSYLGQAAAIWFVTHHGTVSIEMAYAIIAGTSLIAFVIQALQLQLQIASDTPASDSFLHQSRHHLSLGQWILLANAMNLLTIYSIPWVVGYFHGTAMVAAYSAVLFVLNASNPLLASVANLITPVVAKAKAQANERGESGTREAQGAALKYSIQGALLLFPFFAFLIGFPTVALHIFYKPGSPYLALGPVMQIFTLAYGLMYVSAMINSYLCGLGQSRLPFLGQLANASVTLIITIPLVARYGLPGAAYGSIAAVLAQLSFGMYFVNQAQREKKGTGTI
jgi:O-antigen/teichoic acid export membrane protein